MPGQVHSDPAQLQWVSGRYSRSERAAIHQSNGSEIELFHPENVCADRPECAET